MSELKTSIEIPYFTNIINSHHHELEGIYLAYIDNTISNKEIKYSEFITFSQIQILWPPTPETKENENKFKIYKKNKKDILEIHLNKYESRFFDVMATTMNDFSYNINETYTFRIKNVSRSTLQIIEKNIITDNVSKEINGGRPIETYYRVDELSESIILYKYIDPVIRMCCEYIILLDKYFNDPAKLQEFKIPGSNELDETKFQELILHIRKEPNTKFHDAPREGAVCEFGLGRIDCCSEIMHKIARNLNIHMDLFNLHNYNDMKSQRKYTSTPFKTYETFSLPEPEKLLLSQYISNPDIVLLVKIMQKAINEIILASGRVEGAPVPQQKNVTYPKIHLLEILDPDNTTWILRSERFHLSKSPCVHNGLKNLGKIDYFLKYLKLWTTGTQLEFAAVSWLHTIGHALDRLYCGHTEHKKVPQLINTNTLEHIKSSFCVFMKLKLNTGEQYICGIIPCDPTYAHCVDLFFYICMNDFMSIENKLRAIHRNDVPLFDVILANCKHINTTDYFSKLNEMTLSDDLSFETESETSLLDDEDDEDDEDEVDPSSALVSVSTGSDSSSELVSLVTGSEASSELVSLATGSDSSSELVNLVTGSEASSGLRDDTVTMNIKLIIHCIKMHFDKRTGKNRKLQSCFPFYNVDFSYVSDEGSDNIKINSNCNIKIESYGCLKEPFNQRQIQNFLRDYPS